MKVLLTTLLIVAAISAWAADNPSPSVVKGEVLEVKDVEGYTYLRLKTTEGETWAAVAKAPVKEGAEVTIENAMAMNNFESKTLNRTFPTILFGSLAGAGTSQHGAGNAQIMAPKTEDTGTIQVPKASGENAWTVAEIITKAGELKDQSVRVSGKVVKYNPGIMGKNWVHLRDGSGSAGERTNDLLVTTANETKLGTVVTVNGIVRTDKDFGAGYSYKVLIEEATFQP